MAYKKKPNYYSVEIGELGAFLGILEAQRACIYELEIKKGTLNDVFLEITGRDIREGMRA